MQTSSNDAFIEKISRQEFEAVVKLYDRLAHPKEAFDAESDRAEAAFNQTLQRWYDSVLQPKPPFPDFRRAIVRRCKARIIEDEKKPGSVRHFK